MWENIEILNLSQQKSRRNYLVSETKFSYYNVFHRKFITSRNEKKSTILMYEFLYGYVKPKYGENAKLCYMYTDSFAVGAKQIIFTKTL